ncbi:MAG: glycine--tRNA ligase subunit beta, partial [Nevskia sp.]|nr:glycine--tRNA ligase subunit beta [Nevskia sp.]
MNTTETLLIEIGTEDLPARYVVPLAEALRDGFAGGLAKRGLALGTAHSYATPRRIALIVEAVAGRQPNQSVEFTGPALAAALKDGQGNVIGGVETFRDLSTEEELRRKIDRSYTFHDIVSRDPRMHE